MPGSTIEVILRSVLNDAERNQLTCLIDRLASEVKGQSFWIAGQPFTMYQEEPDEETRKFSAPGWPPEFVVGFSTGCREKAGEYFLAMLATRVSEMFGGLVALGGSVEFLTEDPLVLSLDGRYSSQEIGDIVTPSFMYYWIVHSEFKMAS